MQNSDNANLMFQDLQEIRRRIEKRLRGVQGVLVHAALFLVASLGILARSDRGWYWPTHNGYRYGLTDFASIGWITLWSVILLAHGVWAIRRSGLMKKVRTRAIEDELRERIEQEDTHLLENPRRIFHIKGFLDEDMRHRAGLLIPVLLLLIYAVVFWIRLTFVDGVAMWWSSPPEVEAPSVALNVAIRVAPALIIPVALVINLLRRRQRDNKIKQLITAWINENDSSKAKHDGKGKVMRLSDDGELIPVADDITQQGPTNEDSLRQSGFHREQQNDHP